LRAIAIDCIASPRRRHVHARALLVVVLGRGTRRPGVAAAQCLRCVLPMPTHHAHCGAPRGGAK